MTNEQLKQAAKDEAAREVVIADKNTPEHVKSTTLTALFSSSCTHPTVEDYLNRKQ